MSETERVVVVIDTETTAPAPDPVVITSIRIDQPPGSGTVAADQDKTVLAKGVVLPAQTGLDEVKLFLKVYPGKGLTIDQVPDRPSDDDLQPPTVEWRPRPNGSWECRVGPVVVSKTGADNQLVIWAFNPGGGDPVKQLSTFKATSFRGSPSEVKPIDTPRGEGSLGGLSISHPSDATTEVGYAVDNTPGQTFGNIQANGVYDTVPPNSVVYLIVVPGATFTSSSKMPQQPLPGSVLVRTDSNGKWSSTQVPRANCSKTASYPTNQLLVWGSSGGSSYDTDLSNFTGKSFN